MAGYTVTGSGSKRHVNFACEHCGAELASPLAEAGQGFPCPTCGVAFVTPGAAELAAERRPATAVGGGRHAAQPAHGRPATVAYATAAPPPGGPGFPGIVMAAGIIWIIVGAPMLVVTLGLFLLMLTVGGGAAGAGLILLVATVLVGVFGGVFITAGIRTVRGTAGDTLGNGIGSILFGLLMGGLSPNVGRAGTGLALLVAGILALVGRAGYRAWLASRERPRRSYRVAA